jgi:hypothetical protein
MSHYDFTNIAVGDTVIVRDSYGRSLHRVAKVTKTQFVIESGTRFMRSYGMQYAGMQYASEWCKKCASIPNADDIAAVKADQRLEEAISESFSLRRQIETAVCLIKGRREQGWGPSIEASNSHLRRALEALQTKQEELL